MLIIFLKCPSPRLVVNKNNVLHAKKNKHQYPFRLLKQKSNMDAPRDDNDGSSCCCHGNRLPPAHYATSIKRQSISRSVSELLEHGFVRTNKIYSSSMYNKKNPKIMLPYSDWDIICTRLSVFFLSIQFNQYNSQHEKS